MDKYVRVDIVDGQGYYDEERIMDTFILVNPDKRKLEELQELLDGRFEEDNGFQSYESIYGFIDDNFECLCIDEEVEIVW